MLGELIDRDDDRGDERWPTEAADRTCHQRPSPPTFSSTSSVAQDRFEALTRIGRAETTE